MHAPTPALEVRASERSLFRVLRNGTTLVPTVLRDADAPSASPDSNDDSGGLGGGRNSERGADALCRSGMDLDLDFQKAGPCRRSLLVDVKNRLLALDGSVFTWIRATQSKVN